MSERALLSAARSQLMVFTFSPVGGVPKCRVSGTTNSLEVRR
jgi:hypothetical protein